MDESFFTPEFCLANGITGVAWAVWDPDSGGALAVAHGADMSMYLWCKAGSTYS